MAAGRGRNPLEDLGVEEAIPSREALEAARRSRSGGGDGAREREVAAEAQTPAQPLSGEAASSPVRAVPPAAARATAAGGADSQAGAPPAGGENARDSYYISAAVIERLKRAAYWTPGLSKNQIVERALKAELDRLEGERGEPFPAIPREGK